MAHPCQTLKDYPDVPLGAKKLGCFNCRTGDRMNFPQLGLVYCSACPVTRRRMAMGKTRDEATGDKRTT
jgi:hypothetical protein